MTVANPFHEFLSWWFRDSNCVVHGPYRTQRAALRGLLRYMHEHPRGKSKKRSKKRAQAPTKMLPVLACSDGVRCGDFRLPVVHQRELRRNRNKSAR